MPMLREILDLEPVAAVLVGGNEERLPLAGLANSSKQLRDLVSFSANIFLNSNAYVAAGGPYSCQAHMHTLYSTLITFAVTKGCDPLQTASFYRAAVLEQHGALYSWNGTATRLLHCQGESSTPSYCFQVQPHAKTLQLSDQDGTHFAKVRRPAAFSNCRSLSYSCRGFDSHMLALNRTLAHAVQHVPKLDTVSLTLRPSNK